MEHFSLAKWLKSITIGIGLIGLIIYFVIIPLWGRDLVQANLDMADYYWTWLIFSWITAIPCFMVLFEFWKICCEIGKDNSFSRENVKSLRRISKLLVIDSIIVFIGNLVMFFINMNHLSIVFILLIITFAGISVAMLSAALSHLIFKAYKMKEENDLTI